MMWTRIDPFREMDQLRSQLDRLVSEFEDGGWSRPFATAFLPGRAARSYPRINVSEDTDNLYVEAFAPGVDPKSLEISVVRDTLRMAGEKQSLSDEIKPEAYHRNERSAGKFVRTITLPTEVDRDKVKADYSNGVLLLTLPKAEEAKPKQIKIDVN